MNGSLWCHTGFQSNSLFELGPDPVVCDGVENGRNELEKTPRCELIVKEGSRVRRLPCLGDNFCRQFLNLHVDNSGNDDANPYTQGVGYPEDYSSRGVLQVIGEQEQAQSDDRTDYDQQHVKCH